jgi:hypothetical protein
MARQWPLRQRPPEDRTPYLDLGDQDDYQVELSLHELDYYPAVPAEQTAHREIIHAYHARRNVEVGAFQHYRAADPVIELYVPQENEQGRQVQVQFTADETCRLIDLMTRAVDGVDPQAAVPAVGAAWAPGGYASCQVLR